MFDRMSCVLTVAALAAGSQSVAQSPTALERAALEREAAREFADAERELDAEQREIYAAERELASELARTKAEAAAGSAALRRELAKAREQLAVSAGEIARLSAQMTEPVLRSVPNLYRLAIGGQAVLGLNVEDTDLGVLVSGVTPNGPAAAAGVRVGDTIVAVDDVELVRTNDRGRGSPSALLLGQIGSVDAGDEVQLRILRDGDYRDVVVEAGDDQRRSPVVVSNGHVSILRPGGWVASFGHFNGPWSDIELVALTPALGEYFGADKGLLVVRAGRASELGFRDGDVILEIGGREPQTPEHATRILASFEPGESLQASIMRQRRRETLTIEVPADSGSGDGWVRYVR